MNYLILPYVGPPFYTNWYDFENNYVEGMTVFNLLLHRYTFDGQTWFDIEQDHL